MSVLPPSDDPFRYGAYWDVVNGSPRVTRPSAPTLNPDDILIEMDLRPTSWQPSASVYIAHFRTAVGDDHLNVQLVSPNFIRVNRYQSPNAAVTVGQFSTVGLTGRVPIRIRHYGTGSGPFTTQFFWRGTDGVWTLVGSTTYSGSLKSMSGAAFYCLGGSFTGAQYTGGFYGGSILNGATGEKLASVDPVQYRSDGTVPDGMTPAVSWTVAPPTAPLPTPYPGTAGGTDSPDWGRYVRLYVWAAIEPGASLRWGPDSADKLDSGNVWAGTSPSPPGGAGGRLWRDLTCDVLDLATTLGADSADGPITKANAGTASFTLRDENRIYDPLNPSSPFQYAGETRLGPGTAVKIWAEVWSPAGGTDLATELGDQLVTEGGDQLALETAYPASALNTYWLHTGTVDSWSEEWEASPHKRQAEVVSSDAVKLLVALDRGEQPPAGAGDTADQRIARILTYYGWAGPSVLDPSTVTLQATTFAQSAWELLGRTSDDEVGLVYIDASGTLRFRTRGNWVTAPAPALIVGCSPEAPAGTWDIVMDVDVQSSGQFFSNGIYVTRTGGTQQTARSLESIQRYGERDLKRTDLGLADDTQTGSWAAFVLSLVAWPVARLQTVTLKPWLNDASWSDVLGLDIMTERVQVYWEPADATETVQATGRLIGVDHSITRHSWDVALHIAQGDFLGRTLHWGAHPYDRLDRNYSFA